MNLIFLALLAICIFLVTLSWYGWRSLPVSDWGAPEWENVSSWEEVFEQSGKREHLFFPMGRSRTEPGARPYLRTDSLPDDYELSAVDTPPTQSFAFRHPRKGDILIDAGLNESYSKKNGGDQPPIMRLYQRLSRYRYEVPETETMGYYIKHYNLHPSHVFLTHMHPDHVAGLKEVTDTAAVVFGKKENSFYYRMISGKYLRSHKNLRTLDFSCSRRLGPFSKVMDIFGDQSFLAISSPGHTEDHISYFINDKENPVLIVGDLTISRDYFERGIESSVYSRREGHEQLKHSLQELKNFQALYPQVELVYSHSTVKKEY